MTISQRKMLHNYNHQFNTRIVRKEMRVPVYSIQEDVEPFEAESISRLGAFFGLLLAFLVTFFLF